MLSAPGAQLDYVAQRAVDHIPMEMGDALRPVKTASVYQSRSRVRFIPTSGQTFGVGASPANGSTSINIVISSPSDWVDMTSATLNFQIRLGYTAAAATDAFVLDDLATSPFQRCRIYGGGTILHDTLYQNTLALAETYASTPFQVYKSKLGAEGYAWKFNNDNFGAAKNRPAARVVPVGNPAGATGAIATVYDCSVPMSMFSPLFRLDKLFPLRNVGSLNIVLDMDPNVVQNCCYSTAGASNQSLVLNGVEFRADLITVSPLVQAMYDQMCASPEGCPIIGYESPTGLVSSYLGSGAGNFSQKALVFPRVSPSLSHIVTVRRHANIASIPSGSDGTNTVILPLSTFELTGYTAANAQNLATSNFFAVGSKRVPQDPASVAQAFGNTADAFHARQGGFGSVVDAQNFCGVYNVTGTSWDNTAQAQVLAASFELTRDAEILGTGFNMGGQQLIQYLTTSESDGASYNIYAFVFEHKFLRIANNTVMVETQL